MGYPIWIGPGEIDIDPDLLDLDFSDGFVAAMEPLSGPFSTVDFGRAIFDDMENGEFIGRRFTVMYADR